VSARHKSQTFLTKSNPITSKLQKNKEEKKKERKYDVPMKKTSLTKIKKKNEKEDLSVKKGILMSVADMVRRIEGDSRRT